MTLTNFFFSYLSRLEDELIGEDLDYEYDLDEEEEEALLAGETQEVSTQVNSQLGKKKIIMQFYIKILDLLFFIVFWKIIIYMSFQDWDVLRV